jgi:hypothetical protein
VPAAPVVCWIRFLALHQLAVSAYGGGGSVFLFVTLFVQVAAPAPHTTGRLPTVCPDVTKLLAVMTLREATLNPVCLYPDENVTKVLEREDLLGFRRPRQGDQVQVDVT